MYKMCEYDLAESLHLILDGYGFNFKGRITVKQPGKVTVYVGRVAFTSTPDGTQMFVTALPLHIQHGIDNGLNVVRMMPMPSITDFARIACELDAHNSQEVTA